MGFLALAVGIDRYTCWPAAQRNLPILDMGTGTISLMRVVLGIWMILVKAVKVSNFRPMRSRMTRASDSITYSRR